jgi:hypothetical protein
LAPHRADEATLARLVPERTREAVADDDALAVAQLGILANEQIKPTRQIRQIWIRQLRVEHLLAAPSKLFH